MDFMDRFRSFLFGPQGNRSEDHFYDNSTPSDSRQFDDDEGDENLPSQMIRSFDIFTDPLQMHQYFEHQMSQMLRNFGLQGFFEGNQPPTDGGSYFNALEPPADSGELRDHFLKGGYEKATSETARIDEDVDGKVDLGSLGSIVGRQAETQTGNYFFGQSMSTRIIHSPDGSMEKRSTVRDNEGNEQTTITRRIGDKEVTIIKKRDKFGKEETVENLINVDETEKNNFLQPAIQPKVPTTNRLDQNLFDKFFK